MLASTARATSAPKVVLKILVIDDDPQNIGLITAALRTEKAEILTATDPVAGFGLFLQTRPQVVLLDLIMPNVKGMQLLERIVAADPGTEVILMTGHYSTESAVEAIQKGACDYLTKPLELKKLRARIDGLIADAETRRRTLQLERELVETCEFQGIVGRSPLMLDVFANIRRIAPHFRTVLITGATGSGKELVARALHRLSPSTAAPLAVCNCSALVETLIESELFGYVRGAFTGAAQDKVGIFEYANGGIVFLDEIGELPSPAQAKLLRVLQNQEVQRVGSPTLRSVDVRVIAATNRNLKSMVQAGRFREDLYYRLSMIEIELPRLADRREDLALLQRFFLRKFSAQYQKEVTGIARRAQALLARYSWPGNVRELENVIGSACMMVNGTLIDIEDLPEDIRNQTKAVTSEGQPLLSMEEVQRQHLLKVLEHVHGNKSQAAEILGLSRATVYEMLSKIKADAEKKTQT